MNQVSVLSITYFPSSYTFEWRLRSFLCYWSSVTDVMLADQVEDDGVTKIG